jgi:hypothetical protein
MNAQECAKTLLETASSIYNLENDILHLEDRRRQLMLELQVEEASLLTREGGPINGKNAEIRAAQLLQETGPERVQINEFEREIARIRSALTLQQNLFRAHQGILALFASRPDLSQL